MIIKFKDEIYKNKKHNKKTESISMFKKKNQQLLNIFELLNVQIFW